ncbi:MAG: 1-deoxy-D-xylulose-5-phosphate reductoisomerase [Coriobacteriales bacterium]|jgi:1-deoxy-D-xylulose-5-phosphate reductoisomerase|nr:1-deoxy-D-xylulose-5-phosphate reductoisomerase [Coriobacteriales bacterium]
MKRLLILGSTGSIGKQALAVVRAHPQDFQVVGLSGHRQAKLLAAQAQEFGLDDRQVATDGEGIARLVQGARADVVLNALVGYAGLTPSLLALRAGADLAIANKESLVVGGELLLKQASPGQLLPVDSEHSAIWQCLQGEDRASVRTLWITCSGGAFRGWTRAQLAQATAAQALRHPTWQMGAKITIDSATLMNKGFEVIEAHHLFQVPYERIKVVLHPQSVVHSAVEFADGAIKAQLGSPDMRLPIAYALYQGKRLPLSEYPGSDQVTQLDLTRLGDLQFGPIDCATFACFELAVAAGRSGGTMPCVLNAAGEAANLAFREGRLDFLGIEQVVRSALTAHRRADLSSLEQLDQVDAWARAFAEEEIARLA